MLRKFWRDFLVFTLVCGMVCTSAFANISVKAEDNADDEPKTETVLESDSSQDDGELTAGDEQQSVVEEQDGTDTIEMTTENDETVEPTETISDVSVEQTAEVNAMTPDTEFADFLADIKKLEEYANAYAPSTKYTATGLVINYIRNGIEKYSDGSWQIIAGYEVTEFVDYVAAQDEANGTTCGRLRGINRFDSPNGQNIELAHVFGVWDIHSYNPANTDFGGWAGDLTDLMTYAQGKATGSDIEELTKDIRENYLLVDDDGHTFGIYDVRADLDAFYLFTKVDSGEYTVSEAFEKYYTADLTDEARAAFFLNNRFPNKMTDEEIRNAIYTTYKGNTGCMMLEADRGLSAENDLRYACCYAWADYLYDLAKDLLVEQPVEPVEPSDPEPENPSDNDYYSVFSTSTQNLAPGIVQQIKYALTADQKQIVYYIATIDVSREDVMVFANYNENDGSTIGMQTVTDQVAAAVKNHTNPDDPRYIPNYTPIVSTNADFFNMTTGAPTGTLIMEGVEYHGLASSNFFGILKNGAAVIGGKAEWDKYHDQLQEAVGASLMLVKDGKICVKTSLNYYKDRAPRTCVGIKADGSVVMMVLDGRQEPFSTGGSAIEIAQIMLDAGCVTAVNLDGGGSTTFAAKEEGDDEITVVNRPSDGYQRSVSSSILVVSTAKVSNEFDHAVIETEYDYVTKGCELEVTARGVSENGTSAEIPENATYRLSNEEIGTLNENVFTAVKNGEVTIELVADGKVIGFKTIYVCVPNGIQFTKKSINATYGIAVELPVVATFDGKPIKINPDDVLFTLSSPSAGTIDGFVFTGVEESGIKVVTITADLKLGIADTASMSISLYSDDATIFDFENAMCGDRTLAWNREVSNTITNDNSIYYIDQVDKGVDTTYTLALDLREIQIPERLNDLVGLLPGGDSGSSSAWQFLLQLAERVSTLTEVKICLDVDHNFTADVSNVDFVNEYFELTDAIYDEETGKVTITLHFINQTQAIDPDTADPIGILSGLVTTPKDATNVDKYDVVNNGTVDYDIYLRTSTLYSVCQDPEIQEKYGLYPFINPNDPSERGGHFAEQYMTFSDAYTLNMHQKNGWFHYDDQTYYYQNNVKLTGIHKLPAENGEGEYYYIFNENGVCLGTVTGLFELDGELYYAVKGVLATGWRVVYVEQKENYYYFDPTTGCAVDGAQTINGYHYLFENKILVRGDLVKTEDGKYHYKWAGEWIMNSWVEIDGNKYYAGKQPYGYFVTDLHTHIHKYGSETEMAYCLFDETGIWQENFSGLYTDSENNTYLIENGYLVIGAGLVKLGDDYYYFRTSTSTCVKGRSYWITVTNGLLPEGVYEFDETGKMINPPTVETPDPEEPEQPVVKNGIVAEDGSLYYYVDGERTGAGLIQIDGDYYYVRTSTAEVIHGRSYWISVTNDLLPEGVYEFDETGKMINPPVVETPDPEEPELKNGIVAEDGSLYYYVDGVRTGAGLIQIDGDYYYVRTSTAEVIHGRSYWITVTNGLLPEGMYQFADDGKMIR